MLSTSTRIGARRLTSCLSSTCTATTQYSAKTGRAPTAAFRRLLSTPPPEKPPTLSGAAAAKTRAGTGKTPSPGAPTSYIKDRGPVSWPSLFLVGIAAASLVAYYNIERERRLESAMGRVVSSESPDGWTPNPDVMAPRKFKLTPWGWFPEDDGFGPCKRNLRGAGAMDCPMK